MACVCIFICGCWEFAACLDPTSAIRNLFKGKALLLAEKAIRVMLWISLGNVSYIHCCGVQVVLQVDALEAGQAMDITGQVCSY